MTTIEQIEQKDDLLRVRLLNALMTLEQDANYYNKVSSQMQKDISHENNIAYRSITQDWVAQDANDINNIIWSLERNLKAFKALRTKAQEIEQMYEIDLCNNKE